MSSSSLAAFLVVIMSGCEPSDPVDTGSSDAGCPEGGTFALSDGSITGVDGDPWWERGEAATVEVTLTNTGTTAYTCGPGVRIEVDNEKVVVVEEQWSTDLLEGGESRVATLSIQAADDIAVGSGTSVTASVFADSCIGEGCPDPSPYTFGAVIGWEGPE